ncbi:GGDEF domain-containing protein [Aliiglaciecola litoralis]|uniref:diguanylate cyclase n=1 Tax=Aliiglaciecola litoralis TaxID=582857 RepID=A0ABN1LHE4_9ALTE
MEQLSSRYDTLISDTLFSSDPQQSGLSQMESHDIMQQLAASIDLHKLTSVFYAQLKRYLNVDSVTIKFPTGLLSMGDNSQANNIKTLEQVANHTILATLVYGFSNPLSPRETTVLNQLHKHFKFPLKNALEHHNVKQLALKDHLTSLGNRANYQETLQRLISQARRSHEAFGLLVIDMDNFKTINDTFGHHEGDNVLTAMADALRQSVRDTDYVFRFGGDEFCCLLPGSDAATNSKIAQRIRRFMQDMPILARHRVSCSIGSTQFVEQDSEQDLFNRADKALYLAKQSGRSCFKAA